MITLGAGPIQMGILTRRFGGRRSSSSDCSPAPGPTALRRRPLLIVDRSGARGHARDRADRRRAALLDDDAPVRRRGVAGLLTVLFDVSYQAYVPSLVERENILQANAKLALSESVAEVSGPGIAGFLVQALTAPVAIAFDAALVSGLRRIPDRLIRKPEPAPAAQSPSAHIGREIAEGLRFAWRNPYLRAMALRSCQAALFMGFFASLYPLFTVKTLNLPPAVIGVVVVVRRRFRACSARRSPSAWCGGSDSAGRSLGARAVHEPHVVPASDGARIGDAVLRVPGRRPDSAISLGRCSTSRRRACARRPRRRGVLGRVNSAMNLLFNGTDSGGAFAGGALAGVIGVRATMLIGAGGYLVSIGLAGLLADPSVAGTAPAATNAATSAVT